MTARRIVLAAAAVLFFFQLGGHDLWSPDEPYFAEGAREMVVDGQWAVPHVNGKLSTDKPPLLFWLIALFSLPLGTVTEWTARLPSALAGLATVAMTMRLGGRFGDARAAALAGGVLATTYMFWEKSRWSQTDALLCCCIWIALSAFEAHRAGSADGRRAGLLFWTAAALAVLVKGPVGLLLPLGIAVVTLAVDRDLGRWRSFAPAAGPLVFAAIVGAWMAYATLGSGGEYSVWGALRQHVIERGIHGMHHKRPVWYFAEVLPPNLLPWTGLLPGALLLAWRRRGAADRFLLVAVAFVLVFFTLSTEKRELYALPTLPAFALLVAGLVAALAGWRTGDGGAQAPPVGRRWLTLGQAIVGGLLTLVAIALPFAVGRVEEVDASVAAPLAVLLGLTGVATLVAAVRGRIVAAVVAPAIGLSLVYLFSVARVYPGFEASKSARPLALIVADRTTASRAAGVPVYAYHVENIPKIIAFYTSGLYTEETLDPAELARHLERDEEAWALVNGHWLDTLDERVLARARVVEETWLARRPVLLVDNRPGPGDRTLLDLSRTIRPRHRSD